MYTPTTDFEQWMMSKYERDYRPHAERLNATICTQMIHWYLFGKFPDTINHMASEYDLKYALEFYALAPASIKEKLEPLISQWKEKICRDPEKLDAEILAAELSGV